MNKNKINLDKDNKNETGLSEKLIRLNRCTKVVKGGRRFSFSALVVVGNRQGLVGIGFGKANDVPESIRKAFAQAKKNMVSIALNNNSTLFHEVIGRFKCSKVWISPVRKGRGLIAGGTVKTFLELAGIRDVVSKVYGSKNVNNVLAATLNALLQVKNCFLEVKKRKQKILVD